MNNKSSYWVKTLQNGVIGGGISLLLGMVGLSLAFGKTFVITGVITMGQIFVLAPFLFEAYLSVRNAPSKKPLNLLFIGGLCGLIGGAVQAALVLIGEVVNLRAVLVNVSPDLFALLTFNLSLLPGVLVLLGVSLVTGLVAFGVFLLPSRIRGALSQSVMVIVVLGLFRDLIVTVILHWGVVQYAFLWIFAQSGLNIISALIIFVLVGVIAYWSSGRDRKAISLARTPRQQRAVRWGTLGLLGVLTLLLPVILGSYFSEILDNVGIYILMGLGLNIVVGFAGLLDLGYVAFYAIGAYTLGVLTTSEAVGLLHLSFWLATPVALVVAVAFGVILGLPILRLRGDYLAIVTLGFGEIIRIVVLSDWLKPLLGGSEGIQRIGKPVIGTLALINQQQLYYLILVGIILAGFIATRLKDSHLGRSWMALREDEDVAEAMGINKVTTKLLAFAMGALFSGLGGALFATKIGSVYPQSFSFIVSINILSLIIIGGLGSIPGVFIGGLVLVGLPLLLSQFADFRYLVYGAVLVIMMLMKPEGLAPEARRRLELHGEESGPGPQDEPQVVNKNPGSTGGD
ncbi:MAG: leucine/isoleucine/valine transporter permease subunit [Anaerolineales bacterium]|jgi:branched-chain amino acid transport system permease protein